jgi:hypothetical protein
MCTGSGLGRLLNLGWELNCQPLLFEGTTLNYFRTSWWLALDIPGWSRSGLSGPGHNRGLQIQFSSADWGLSVQFFPSWGFQKSPVPPGVTAFFWEFFVAQQPPSQKTFTGLSFTRGANGALYRKCHRLTQTLLWSYVCRKLIPSFSSTIPFNEDN